MERNSTRGEYANAGDEARRREYGMTLLAKREALYSTRSGECFIARRSGKIDEACLRHMKHGFAV